MVSRLNFHDAATYQICFQGRIAESWVKYLAPDLDVEVNQADPLAITTTLTGTIGDQAALLGLLNYLYNLGLPLLSVEYIV